jgi:hypothetical protein
MPHSCAGGFLWKEGGIQVLADLASSSQIEESLLSPPPLPQLAEKMIYLEAYMIFRQIHHVHLLISQKHYLVIIGG